MVFQTIFGIISDYVVARQVKWYMPIKTEARMPNPNWFAHLCKNANILPFWRISSYFSRDYVNYATAYLYKYVRCYMRLLLLPLNVPYLLQIGAELHYKITSVNKKVYYFPGLARTHALRNLQVISR